MGTFYRSQHELIFAFKTSKGEHINNFGLGDKGRHRSNVWTYAGVNTFRQGRMEELASHPTVKPLKMVSDAILDCSKPGGIVLDPFLGSGTTLAAAARTGRRGAGIELDPLYTDLCIRRLEQQTGETTRLESGETFTELRERRLSQKLGI
jgi:DNA modification methylase